MFSKNEEFGFRIVVNIDCSMPWCLLHYVNWMSAAFFRNLLNDESQLRLKIDSNLTCAKVIVISFIFRSFGGSSVRGSCWDLLWTSSCRNWGPFHPTCDFIRVDTLHPLEAKSAGSSFVRTCFHVALGRTSCCLRSGNFRKPLKHNCWIGPRKNLWMT